VELSKMYASLEIKRLIRRRASDISILNPLKGL